MISALGGNDADPQFLCKCPHAWQGIACIQLACHDHVLYLGCYLFIDWFSAGIADNDIPHVLQGSPIVLITAGLMAIAFIGFSGLI